MVKGLMWLTAGCAALVAVGHVLGGSIFAAFLALAVAAAITPPVFVHWERPWKKMMEEAGNDGSVARPLAAVSIAWLIAIISIVESAPSAPNLNDALTSAQPYFVISEEDTSFATRERRAYYIALRNPVSSREELAHTVMRAALEQQERTNAAVVSVFLEPDPEIAGKGLNIALVHYIPDGQGFSGSNPGVVWDVEAVMTLPKWDDVQFWVTWYALRDTYADENDLVMGGNDKALRAKVLETLGIAEPYSLWFPQREDFSFPTSS